MPWDQFKVLISPIGLIGTIFPKAQQGRQSADYRIEITTQAEARENLQSCSSENLIQINLRRELILILFMCCCSVAKFLSDCLFT